MLWPSLCILTISHVWHGPIWFIIFFLAILIINVCWVKIFVIMQILFEFIPVVIARITLNYLFYYLWNGKMYHTLPYTVFAWLSAWYQISASPLFFAETGGLASAKDRLLMLNFPPEVTKIHTFPLAVSANQPWIPPFQQSLRALTVHIPRMIILLTK